MEFLQQVILLILTATLPILARAIWLWLAERKGLDEIKKWEAELSTVDSIAYRAVRLAEDVIKGPGKGQERLEYACGWASDALKEKGYNKSAEEVESFVRAMFNMLVVELKYAREQIE